MRKLREEHLARLATLPPQDLVFVDESGANRAMCRTHARAKKGQRAYASAPQNYGANVTILSSLSLGGITASMYLEGASDGAVFLSSIREVLAPSLWPGAVVFLDNLSSHKSPLVRAAIEAAGATRLFLPPYSPDLNPIEKAWSKLKAHLRKRAARSYQALGRAITQGLGSISPDDARAFFHSAQCPG